ncbi:hypothetical protein ACTI_24600 [Actinoplanes sp. OR16]|uniref:hypothetical protein n=1 Tax=Actinoplanes sp. OR16 TaxID=946334 RepID=UPI000F6D28D8|nr:hypothetical protein [Actinoplanes sp. OR16]BBH65775.1 hypothetical protein ACTI_24600 [Actinoplanes sp. OR16]
MRVLLVGRLAAATLSITTFAYLFVHDSWRRDNPFLVPDLILCVVLALAASLPAPAATAALPLGFAYAAGVLAVSVSSYAVTGTLGAPSLLGATAATVLAAASTRRRPDPRAAAQTPVSTPDR